MQITINTRSDLDAIAGTPEHVTFMAMLAGTLYRLEKDDTAQAWVAIEDNSTIERFNFTRADFPDAQPPALPEYAPTVVAVPEVVTMRVVSAFQARAALLQADLLDDVEAYMALPETDPFVKLAWDKAQDFRRDSPTIAALIPVLGITEAQLDDLFGFAKTITA